MVGVRGDFIDRCASYTELVPALQEGAFVVGGMTEAELRQVITGPATVAGLELEAGLVDAILADLRETTGGPTSSVGALPLLSQAMLLTWHHREGNRLTRRSYAAVGGLARAVETSAEAVYRRLTTEQQAIAQAVFQRMTLVNRDGHWPVGRSPATSSLTSLEPARVRAAAPPPP